MSNHSEFCPFQRNHRGSQPSRNAGALSPNTLQLTTLTRSVSIYSVIPTRHADTTTKQLTRDMTERPVPGDSDPETVPFTFESCRSNISLFHYPSNALSPIQNPPRKS
jgi:hypothetical protein